MACTKIFFSLGVRKSHQRSDEGKKRRNIKMKLARKEKRKDMKRQEDEATVLLGERVMDLEMKNAVLSRVVKSGKQPLAYNPVNNSRFSLSIRKWHQNKSLSVVKYFSGITVPTYHWHDVSVFCEIGTGVFGKVSEGYLKSIQQKVVIKEFSHHSTSTGIMAEAKAMIKLQGHKNFPLLYGFIAPNKLVMEYIANKSEPSPTLKEFISSPHSNIWYSVIIDILKAIHSLHVYK